MLGLRYSGGLSVPPQLHLAASPSVVPLPSGPMSYSGPPGRVHPAGLPAGGVPKAPRRREVALTHQLQGWGPPPA